MRTEVKAIVGMMIDASNCDKAVSVLLVLSKDKVISKSQYKIWTSAIKFYKFKHLILPSIINNIKFRLGWNHVKAKEPERSRNIL